MKYAVAALFAVAAPSALAQGLGDLGSILGNVIEGVFTSSDITIADVAGEYRSEGPAVCFKSESFLKKAGGVAVAATVETKLDPYYKQLGLNDCEMTIGSDETFSIGMKGFNLGGTVTQNSDKTFEFHFLAFGKIPLGSVTAYIEKSPRNVNVMFDATKFSNLLQTVSKYIDIKSLKAISAILGSYDGMCVGFKLKPAGGNAASGKNCDGNSGKDSTQKSGLDALRDILSR